MGADKDMEATLLVRVYDVGSVDPEDGMEPQILDLTRAMEPWEVQRQGDQASAAEAKQAAEDERKRTAEEAQLDVGTKEDRAVKHIMR